MTRKEKREIATSKIRKFVTAVGVGNTMYGKALHAYVKEDVNVSWKMVRDIINDIALVYCTSKRKSTFKIIGIA